MPQMTPSVELAYLRIPKPNWIPPTFSIACRPIWCSSINKPYLFFLSERHFLSTFHLSASQSISNFVFPHFPSEWERSDVFSSTVSRLATDPSLSSHLQKQPAVQSFGSNCNSARGRPVELSAAANAPKRCVYGTLQIWQTIPQKFRGGLSNFYALLRLKIQEDGCRTWIKHCCTAESIKNE